MDGFCLVDKDGRYLDANEVYCRMTGYRREELLKMRIKDVEALETEQDVHERIRRIMEQGATRFETKHKCKDGKVIDVEVSVNAPADETLLVFLRDITGRKRLAEERELTLRLLDRINSCADLRELMREMTGLLRDVSGCEAVGIRLREGEDFPYFETAGFPARFVRMENQLCAVDSQGRRLRDGQGNPVLECMCGNILCGRFDPARPFFTVRGSFWTNSTTQLLASTTAADRQARTRNRCHGEGYESVALIPLRAGGETFGLLQFNDPRPGRFTPEKIARLEQLAGYLAIALAQRQAENALWESERKFQGLFESSRDALMTLEPPFWRFTSGNLATVKMFGVKNAEEFTSLAPWELSPERQPDGRASAEKAAGMIERAMREGSHSFEWTHRRVNGEEFPATVLLSRMEFKGKAFLQASIRDITGRKQAEKDLQEAADRFQLVTRATNDAIWDWI